MKLFTIMKNGEETPAVSRDGKTLYLVPQCKSVNDIIVSGALPKITDDLETMEISEAELIAPIPHPLQDVICLGLNYTAHASEAARFSGEAFGGDRPWPIFFSKRVNTAPGPDGQIPAHADIVDSLDYECELGVIIGKDALNVDREDVKDYIFGYTIVNDVSARNLQTRHKQWYFGKSLDGLTPIGPCVVTADMFAFPPALPIRCHVNGELRQDSDTAHLITGIDEIIAMLSQGMTLKAGTIIATGTPAGVGMGMTPPVFLKAGDVIECEIEGIGVLKDTVVD